MKARQPVYKDKVRLPVYLEREEYEALQALSLKCRVTMSQIARRLLQDKLGIGEGSGGR